MSGDLSFLTDAERKRAGTLDQEQDDFILRFQKWAGMKTDAPTYTVKAAALQALSLAAGDTVVLPPLFGSKGIHLNLFIMVVGPSTTMRKSTVLNFVQDLLPTNQQTHQPYIQVLDDVSIQALNKAMADAGKNMSPILLSVDEVAGLFQLARKKDSYLGSLDKLLMKAFDHSPVHIIRVNAKIEAPMGAFVNVFAVSTPEPLAEVLGSDDVESGLLPRFIVFDARDALRGERIPLQKRQERHEEWLEIRDDLKEFLYGIAADRANGIPNGTDDLGNPTFPVTHLEITDEAFQRIDDIEAAIFADAGKDTTGLGAIKGRAFWHIAKLSGLFALAREGLKATIEVDDVLRAAWLVEVTTADLVTMAEEVGSNAHERLVNSVVDMLDETTTGTMRQSSITRRLKLSARDAREVLGTLVVRDLVTASKDAGGHVLWTRTAA